MPYTFTKSQLSAILAGPSLDGFITLARFKKLTTPPAFRVFRTYMRPRCPFRHYLHLRNQPYFDTYLKHHRRKHHPLLTKPLLDLPRLIHHLKNIAADMQNSQNQKTSYDNPVILSVAKSGFADGLSKTYLVNPVKTSKMQNKPKSNFSKITVSDFLSKTNDYPPTTSDQKNKPNFRTSKKTVSPYDKAGCWKPETDSCLKNKPKQTQSAIGNCLLVTDDW